MGILVGLAHLRVSEVHPLFIDMGLLNFSLVCALCKSKFNQMRGSVGILTSLSHPHVSKVSH